MVTTPPRERRVEYFTRVCRAGGVKLTHQRLEIFKEIARTEDHPDAELLFRRGRVRLPMVSLDTVYRTLWQLKDLGLVVTLGSNWERRHLPDGRRPWRDRTTGELKWTGIRVDLIFGSNIRPALQVRDNL